MTKRHHILLTTTSALIIVLTILFLFGRTQQSVHANTGTVCVAPGGVGCNSTTCGGSCFGSIQDAVDAAAVNDEIRIADGNYTDIQARNGVTQVVYISKTITIRGGYNSDLTSWDPEIYASKPDAQRQGRVVYITGDISPTLENLILTGGNATGQIAGCFSESYPDGCGGGIYVFDSQPIIVNNVITNNVAAVTTAGLPDGYTGYGGGLYLFSADNAVIINNLIISNTASLAMGGSGGGLQISNSKALVDSNQIIENVATTQNTVSASGGGISIKSSDVTIQNNLVQGNWANAFGGGHGAGFYQWYDFETNTIADNKFTGNHGTQTIYLGYSESRFEANQIVGNQTSIGLFLFNSYEGVGPTLVNNIIARSGEKTFSASGHVNFPLYADLIHNTLVSDGTGYGIYAENEYVNLNITNTIVASHTWGITSTVPTGSIINPDHTLFWGNDHNGILGTNPVYGDPNFVDPNDDYHIRPGSKAIDVGLPTNEITDIDGNPRPIGYGPDIGADEILMVFIPLILR